MRSRDVWKLIADPLGQESDFFVQSETHLAELEDGHAHNSQLTTLSPSPRTLNRMASDSHALPYFLRYHVSPFVSTHGRPT